MSRLVTLRKFAEMVGVSPAAISKAIKEGRLIHSVRFDENGQVKGVFPDQGVKEWELVSPLRVSKKIAENNAPDKPLPSSNAMASYAQAKAVRENYQARIAKLIYEEKLGKLVELDSVKLKAFETARVVRDQLLNIPNRISSELAAEGDPLKINAILTKEITDALEELARYLSNGSQ